MRFVSANFKPAFELFHLLWVETKFLDILLSNLYIRERCYAKSVGTYRFIKKFTQSEVGHEGTNVMRCAIWYHLCDLKNVKNTHGGMVPNCATHHKCPIYT